MKKETVDFIVHHFRGGRRRGLNGGKICFGHFFIRRAKFVLRVFPTINKTRVHGG